MKIAFIGGGNMGEAILAAMLKKNLAEAKDITVSDVVDTRRHYIMQNLWSPYPPITSMPIGRKRHHYPRRQTSNTRQCHGRIERSSQRKSIGNIHYCRCQTQQTDRRLES